MIQLVFVFGVLLPTLITVACFIGFLVCWFRFRSLKRHQAADRKSSGAACPRRCRVYVASTSTADGGPCSYRTERCFWSPTGSSIPAGWVTRVVDRDRNSVVLPLTADVINTDLPSTATAEVGRVGTSIKHPDSYPGNSRSVSGMRSSITLPGLLSANQGCRKFGTVAPTGIVRRLSNAVETKPEVYISGAELQKKGGLSPSRAVTVDACYVEVEPIVYAAACSTSFCRRSRISTSRSIDGAVSKSTRPLTTTSGLSGDRKYHWLPGDNDRMLKTREMPRLAHARRHHSLAEVPHHGELKIKTGDQTSLDF